MSDPRLKTTGGDNLKCSCGGNTFVIDSRGCVNGSIRRRRECKACRERFTTYEAREDTPHLPRNADALNLLRRDACSLLARIEKLISEATNG